MSVFPENPCEYAVEFIRRMRNHPDIIQIPSSRQVLSIPRMLLARFYRKGSITPNDYIEISTVTSFPDNQELAKSLSFEILFPNYNKDMIKSFFGDIEGAISEKEEDFLDQNSRSELDRLQDLIEEIEANKSTDIDLMKQLEDFMNEINKRRHEEPYNSALQFFNDDSELYKHQISNLSQLIEEAQKRLMQKINSLNPEEIKAAKELGLNAEIQNKSLRDWERITSKALDNKEISSDIADLIRSGNLEELIQSIKFLKESQAVSKEDLDGIMNHLEKNIKNLDRLFNSAKNLGEMPSFDQEKVLNNSINQNSFEHNFNLANSLDQFYGTDLRSSLLKKYEELQKVQDLKLSLDSLAKSALANKSWNELFNRALNNAMEKAKQENNAFEALKSLTNNLRQLMNSCANLHCSQKMSQKVPEMAIETLQACESPHQLKNSVEFLRNIGLTPDPEEITQKGQELGMSEEDIFELIEPNYQLLKKLIESNVKDFERFSNLMEQIKEDLNAERIKELISSALANDNREAMGAIGHFDLEQAIKGAQQTGGNEGMSKLISCLQAGSGENLLKQWFIHRDKLPSVAKEKVKALAKKMLIELGIYYSRSRLGSSVSGPIPINVVRPFIIGDDFENVDLEETLYNILEKGKKLSHINYEDFFVFETAKGLRSACFELDISGSMSGEKLAYMSICISMLIYGLRKDELAITFFESNTHVLKELREKVDLEKIADELLSVTAKGGTRLQAALEWARKQFKEKSNSREKLNVLFTDAEIYDLREAVEELRIFRSLGIDFILVCPELQYNLKEAEKMVKIAGGQLLTINNWEDFPKLISDIIKAKF